MSDNIALDVCLPIIFATRFKKRLSSAGDARGAGGNQDETLPPSVARVWRTFDVTKQIEFEKKERQKAHKARQEKTRRAQSRS